MTNTVAFRTMAGPSIHTGQELGLNGVCRFFTWEVEFFVTNGSGLNPGTSSQTGRIVQKVHVKKEVKKCDNTIDAALSNPDFCIGRSAVQQDGSRICYEVFDIASGITNNDVVQVVFPDNRKTKVSITMEASFHDPIAGATYHPTPGNPYGANGVLSGQPTGFSATLIRKLEFDVNCCNASTFSWSMSAENIWNTYSEKWKHSSQQEQVIREKKVDGQTILD